MGENVLKFGTYVRVGNAAEAYELLQKNRNNKIVGGGIWMRLGSRRVATAIDLSACGLDQIEETETEFRIGAMCTLRQLERHTELNALVNHVFEFAVHDIVGVAAAQHRHGGRQHLRSLWLLGRALGVPGARFVC